jgi:phage I-like protein
VSDLGRLVACSLDVAPDAPLPTEFRIFKAGVNETQHGSFLYDATAAAAVWEHYQKSGVDCMIDLEHSVLAEDDSPRTDTKDARGWFKLEQRGGELWAVNVTWTPDGERRLREKTQRYVSPLFLNTKEDRRVVKLVNVALVSMPATDDAAPLVAASRLQGMTGAKRLACYALLCTALAAEVKRKTKRS